MAESMEIPLPATRVEFAGHTFQWALSGPDPWCLIAQVLNKETGQFLGQPARFKDAGGRVSMDRPSVSAGTFITADNQDGPIADG